MPAITIIRMKNRKTGAARSVAAFKLSARHPSDFGLSRCRAKLITSHRGNKSQVFGLASWNFQMYSATNAGNAKPSSRFGTDAIMDYHHKAGRNVGRRVAPHGDLRSRLPRKNIMSE